MLDDTSLFINDEATIKGTLMHISKSPHTFRFM